MTPLPATIPGDLSVAIFHGQLSVNLVRVYARLDALPGGGPWTLTGQLRGPDCQFGKTLAVTVPFRDQGGGPTLLARAVLTDPCCWSPEFPALYRATLELRRDGQVVRTFRQLVGLRDLHARGESLFWSGQRWVLRGVHRETAPAAPWSRWRELAAGMLVDDPDEELCEEASRTGIPLVARVAGSGEEGTRRLARLSQWPAVILAVLEPSAGCRPPEKPVTAQLLLAGWMPPEHAPIPEWYQAGLVDARDQEEAVRRSSGRRLPVIASRTLSGRHALVDARNACDLLQRDLAPLRDFAGYVV